ncbi:MAG: squalene synthase HpnC [Myxococcales bacterium]|nr:squalene synthase HpnC [Myxococcales bacterium]
MTSSGISSGSGSGSGSGSRPPRDGGPRIHLVEGDDPARDGPYPDGARRGGWSLEDSYAYCERLASAHYENFPVASRFVPAPLRPHVTAVYAFARTADDFADEPRYEGRRVEALNEWEQLLERSYHEEAEHPVFIALRDTVRRHDIPITPFQCLLTGFRMDVGRRRYRTFDELRRYCSKSAEPVGRIVLEIHGYHDPGLHRFSDDLCAALQITNMLQDVGVDVVRGQHYLPDEDLVYFGVREQDLVAKRATPAFRELMAFSVARARSMFMRGKPLIRRVSAGLSMELEATWRGGVAILDRIEAVDYDVLRERPKLERLDVAGIAVRSLLSYGRRFIRGE